MPPLAAQPGQAERTAALGRRASPQALPLPLMRALAFAIPFPVAVPLPVAVPFPVAIPFPILAQPDLEEHEARGEHEAARDRDEREHLADRGANRERARAPGEHQQCRAAKGQDAGVSPHRGARGRRRPRHWAVPRAIGGRPE